MHAGIPQFRNNPGLLGPTRVLMFLMLTVIFHLLFYGTASASNLGLIEPSSLHKNISRWMILDARPKSDWQAGHIPGSVSFSWEDYTRTDMSGVPYRVWPPEELAAELGKMGIDENTPVTVYGDADRSWGGEGWVCWVFSRLGHKGPIRLLDGGIQAWKRNNFMTTSATEAHARPLRYTVRLNTDIDISTSELARGKANFAIVDNRSFLEWMRGSIPGAVRINWEDFYSGPDRRPLSGAAFRNLLKQTGVDTGKPVVYYCTGGIRSAYAWMVHQLSGLPGAKNYEGGFEAWKRLSK